MTDWKNKNPVVAPCGNYLYKFEWEWSNEKPCVFIMLNPSITLKLEENRTIKNCKTIADSEDICGRKHGKLIAVDLFPYVAKDAEALKDASEQGKDIYGLNDLHEKCLRDTLKIKDALIVVAWGFIHYDKDDKRRSYDFQEEVKFGNRYGYIKEMIEECTGSNKVKRLIHKYRDKWYEVISHPYWLANAEREFKQDNGQKVEETWQEREKRIEGEILRNAVLEDWELR